MIFVLFIVLNAMPVKGQEVLTFALCNTVCNTAAIASYASHGSVLRLFVNVIHFNQFAWKDATWLLWLPQALLIRILLQSFILSHSIPRYAAASHMAANFFQTANEQVPITFAMSNTACNIAAGTCYASQGYTFGIGCLPDCSKLQSNCLKTFNSAFIVSTSASQYIAFPVILSEMIAKFALRSNYANIAASLMTAVVDAYYYTFALVTSPKFLSYGAITLMGMFAAYDFYSYYYD